MYHDHPPPSPQLTGVDKGGLLGTGIGGPGPSKAPIGGVLGAAGIGGTGLAGVLGGASDKGEVLVCDRGGLQKSTVVLCAHKDFSVLYEKMSGRGESAVLSPGVWPASTASSCRLLDESASATNIPKQTIAAQ